MRALSAIFGIGLLAIVIVDAFQTIIVARHSQKLPAVTRLFYQLDWLLFAASAGLIKSDGRREKYLGVFGPLSLLGLLFFWAVSLIAAFAMLQLSADLHINGSPANIAEDIYFSAATFFTLGSAEPQNPPSKYLMVLEAGFGFTFLGLVVGYLPVLYQSFSNRELRILLLDARAGSPPSAAEFVLRRGANAEKMEERLADWEEWALDLLQSHLSYPMLAYYRSQHTNQSWLAALTAVLDVSVVVMLSSEDDLKRQAEFTFAAGRHALVHTASIFRTRPLESRSDRLPAEEFARLRNLISDGHTPLRPEQISEPELRQLRAMYEPYAYALAAYFLIDLPAWFPSKMTSDNWRATSWEP